LTRIRSGEQCRVLENKNKYDKNNSNIYCDLGKACNFTCNPGYTESTLKPFCLPKMPPAWEIEPKCTSQKCGDELSNYRKFPINVKLDTSSSNGNFEIDQEYELSIYFVSFDTKLRMPQYSIALQDKKQKITNCKRKNYFYKHPCNEIQITTGDFNNTGYNRGHLTPNEAMCFSQKAANATFLIINVAAQDPDTNQQSWKDLEKKVSDFSETYSSIVVTGVCSDVKKIINTKNNVLNVPECFWKMICFQLEFNGVYHTIVFGVSAENSIGATQKERNDQLKIILPQSEIIKKNSNIKKELIWDESKILILSQTKVLAPSLKKQITLPDPDRCKTSNLKDLDASLLNYLNDKILNTFTK